MRSYIIHRDFLSTGDDEVTIHISRSQVRNARGHENLREQLYYLKEQCLTLIIPSLSLVSKYTIHLLNSSCSSLITA
jgi:hypothetical protein